MDHSECGQPLYKIALSMTPSVNAELVRRMEERGMTPEEFMISPTAELCRRLDLRRSDSLQHAKRDEALIRARKEMEYMDRHNIRFLFLTDESYPELLTDLHDAPVGLYVLGTCDLNSPIMLSMVGTRRCTPYGRNFAMTLIRDLADYFDNLTVVSGLAYGIDIAAHQAALEAHLPTVAVVAHGLNTVYPAQHTEVARTIVRSGGCIISEYPSGTPAHKGNFLARNRIVAGLSPLTIVAESEIKGGAMSTARHANDCDRQVMALPGRNSDTASSGCNNLIRRHLASLVENAADVMELMGWKPRDLHVKVTQRNLFPELDGDVKIIYDCLRFEDSPLTPDAIRYKTGLPIRRIMELLPDMEFDGIVVRGAGNKYMVI